MFLYTICLCGPHCDDGQAVLEQEGGTLHQVSLQSDKGSRGPNLAASRWGKQLPMFLGRQVIRQVRPDGRGGWPKDGGPQCPSEEHCRGPPAMSGNSPAPGPQNLLQEEVRRAEVDHCQGMGGKVIDDAS